MPQKRKCTLRYSREEFSGGLDISARRPCLGEEGGVVVEINWRMKTSGGTLPVGDLNMPGLRVLRLSDNYSLKGERKRENVRVKKTRYIFI